MTASPKYRSLQQIAAKSLHKDLGVMIERVVEFAAMSSPAAHKDRIEKLRKVQRGIGEHMHKDDKP